MLRFLVLLASLAAPVANAQQTLVTGPKFVSSAVNAERFDTVFEFVAPLSPLFPLFRNQPADARFDAVVCNQDAANRGAVRVSGLDTLNYLSPGECTMFANIPNLEFSRPDGEDGWTATIYLRVHR